MIVVCLLPARGTRTMSANSFTRRRTMATTAGALAAALAGCIGGDEGTVGEGHDDPHADIQAHVDAYVVAYHWGYAAFDEHGDELDLIEVAPNTELTIHAVNDHAYDAFEDLPGPVAEQLEEFEGLERTKERVAAGDLPELDHMSVEEAYEEAHGPGHDHDHEDNDDHHGDGHGDGDDHGHEDDDDHHGDGHGDEEDHHDDEPHEDDHDHDHGDARLDHGFRIPGLGVDVEVPADATSPTIETVVTEEPGEYMAQCTVPCGPYHTYQRQDLIRVTE